MFKLNEFMQKIKFNFLFFLIALLIFTFIFFSQVFLKNQIPFSANLLASFFSPWSQEKFNSWEGGIPNKPIGKDDLLIFYPQRTFSNQLLKNAEIPLWNPYSFSGNYHLGLSETAVFYPLNILFLFFSQVNVWTFLIIIQPVISGLGMFLFLRKLKLTEKSTILGSLAFAFSGIIMVRSVEGLSVGHTLIWIPYVFWGIQSFFESKKIRFLWVIFFSLIFSLLSGWFQYTFYIYIFSFIYSIYKLLQLDKKAWKKQWTIFLPFMAFIFASLFHTLPAYQVLLDSPRQSIEGHIFSHLHLMPFFHVFTFIFPDFWGNPAVYNYFGKSEYKESILFIGIIPLLFSVVTLFKKKNKQELFFLISTIFSFVLAIDNPISRFILSFSIPVFSSFLPNRIFLITTFSLCVLAASGFDYLQKKESDFKLVIKSLLCLFLTAAGIFAFFVLRIINNFSILNKVNNAGINTSIESVQLRSSILPFGFLIMSIFVFIIFKKRYEKNIFFFIVIVILFFQSFLFGQKYLPFSNRQFLYPNHQIFDYLQKHQDLDRFMSIGSGHIAPNIPLQFNLFSPEGVGSMYPLRYGEFVRYMKLGSLGISDKVAFDLEIYPKDFFQPKNPRLFRFLELSSTKYIVVDKKSLRESEVLPSSDIFSMLWENEKWQIFKFKQSMPRFFVTGQYQIIRDKKKILQSIFSKEFNREKVIIEENPGFESKPAKGKVEIRKYSPNEIILKVFSNEQSLIYLSDNYSKAFRVFIDNHEGKILRANYTFRAIPVPQGEHKIVIFFDNKLLIIGFVNLFFILLLGATLTTIYKKHV